MKTVHILVSMETNVGNSVREFGTGVARLHNVSILADAQPVTPPAVKALFLHRGLPFHGGVPTSFVNLAQCRDPDRVGMWSGSFKVPTSWMVQSLSEAGVEMFTIEGDGCIRPARGLMGLLQRTGVQVAVCGSFKSDPVAKLASLRLGCRVVPWLPSIPLVIAGRLSRSLFRHLARRYTIAFFLEAERRAHAYPAHAGVECSVYYGAEDCSQNPDMMPYPCEEPDWLGLLPEHVLIGRVAEFFEWKDLATLLAALNAPADRYPHLDLVLIGAGEGFLNGTGEPEKLGAAGPVHFLARLEDARRALGLLDVTVHPSRGEGFGLAVAEAMLPGPPVVTSDEGALPEIVLNAGAELLFRSGNAGDWQTRSSMSCRTETAGKPLPGGHRAYRLEKFNVARFAEQMTQILKAGAVG